MRSVLRWIYLTVFLTAMIAQVGMAAPSKTPDVYVISVESEIETGLSETLQRAFTEAESSGAKAILLKINTLGGRVDAAIEMGQLIRDSKLPVIAYVEDHAFSAGAYIALNATHVVMSPGSTIGAAEPRTLDGKTADPKIVAAWRSAMQSVAEFHHRDGRIAAGMVDVNVVVPGIKQSGELISLSAEQAVKTGMADSIAATPEEAMKLYGYDPASTQTYHMSIAEKISRFVTHPAVIPILLIIGVAGIVVEMIMPGVTLPGVIGALSLGLFFFGHMVAGFAGWESISLFLLGVALMILEIFITGFGIIGLAGLVSIGASVAIAVYDTTYGVESFLLALVVAGVAVWIAIRYFGHRGAWNKIVLKQKMTTQDGYVANRGYHHLLSQEGMALTPLRPAGTASIQNIRYDVVTEGDFIEAGSTIQVIKVEGGRVVVRKVPE